MHSSILYPLHFTLIHIHIIAQVVLIQIIILHPLQNLIKDMIIPLPIRLRNQSNFLQKIRLNIRTDEATRVSKLNFNKLPKAT